jgi:AcrR family transcriptional regulator
MLIKSQSDTLPPNTNDRRSPRQPRSHRTRERILNTASSLLEDMPVDELTTTRIAADARVSTGSLYRFFPDKQSIIDAVAVRHVEQFRASLATVVLKIVAGNIARLKKPEPADLLNAIIDAYVLYLDAHPDFCAISFGRHVSPATRERQMAPGSGITGLLKSYMMEQLGAADSFDLDLKLRLVSAAGECLIAYAYEQPTRDARDRMISEMKKMLGGYLFPQPDRNSSSLD